METGTIILILTIAYLTMGAIRNVIPTDSKYSKILQVAQVVLSAFIPNMKKSGGLHNYNMIVKEEKDSEVIKVKPRKIKIRRSKSKPIINSKSKKDENKK